MLPKPRSFWIRCWTKKELPTAPTKVKGKIDRKEIVLRLAKKQEYIIRKDVEAELNVSQAYAILILRELVENGLLIKEGAGKQSKYRIAD